MINKKIITLRLDSIDDERKIYKYVLVRNKEGEMKGNMDDIEIYIHTLVFGEGGFSRSEIEFVKFIDEFSARKDSYEILKKLDNMANSKLNSYGANQRNVPFLLRILNGIIFVATIIVNVIAVVSGAIEIEISSMQFMFFYFILMAIGYLMPLIVFLLYFLVIAIIQAKVIISRISNKLFKKDLYKMIIVAIVAIVVMAAVTIKLPISNIMIPFEVLLGIAFLIMKTDNLMIQNDEEVLAYYYRLKDLKYKIQNYSLLKERNAEQVELWDYYMTFAISFGVADKVIKNSSNKFKYASIDKGYLINLSIDVLSAMFDNY